MKAFPEEKINIDKAILSGTSGNVSIELFLVPFTLTIDDYSEQVNTSIRLDAIDISADMKDLEGGEFKFPVNPEPGYIDGSVYFFAVHNPVDVTSIKFESIDSKKIAVKLQTYWALEFERTGFRNFSKLIEAELQVVE